MIAQHDIQPTLSVRQATHADIAFLAWCNYTAAAPAPDYCYWDSLLDGLNTTTIAFLQAIFQADALAWGRCEDFMIIEEHGQPIAGASGFVMDADDFRPLRLAQLPTVAGLLGWSNAALAQFQQSYLAVWSDPQDVALAASAPWTIECVAVIPEARGRGVAKVLLEALLERGRALGHTSAGIAVTIGNEPARRAYEAVGFQMYVTYGAAYFGGAFPGTIKYQLSLIEHM